MTAKKMKNMRVANFSNIILVVSSILFMVSCATLPEDVEHVESHVLQNTESTQLAKDLEPLIAKHPDQSGFHLLNKGMEAIIARIALIEAAEKSLDVQYYIWHDDLTGKVIHNRLLHV